MVHLTAIIGDGDGLCTTATLTKHKGELNLVWSEEKLENGSQTDYLRTYVSQQDLAGCMS